MPTATFGFFECPVCIDFFLVPDWHTRKLPLLARVNILCPECKQTIQVHAVEIDTVHNTEIDYRPHATVVSVQASILGTKSLRDGKLTQEIIRKRREREGDFQSSMRTRVMDS